jgi:hypothetical protein
MKFALLSRKLIPCSQYARNSKGIIAAKYQQRILRGLQIFSGEALAEG